MCGQANDWYNYCQLWMQSQRSLHGNCKHCGGKGLFKPSDSIAVLPPQRATFCACRSRDRKTFLPSLEFGGSQKHVPRASIGAAHLEVASERRVGGVEGWKERGEGGLNEWQASGWHQEAAAWSHTAPAVLFHLAFVLHTNCCCAMLPNLPSFFSHWVFFCMFERKSNGSKASLISFTLTRSVSSVSCVSTQTLFKLHLALFLCLANNNEMSKYRKPEWCWHKWSSLSLSCSGPDLIAAALHGRSEESFSSRSLFSQLLSPVTAEDPGGGRNCCFLKKTKLTCT